MSLGEVEEGPDACNTGAHVGDEECLDVGAAHGSPVPNAASGQQAAEQGEVGKACLDRAIGEASATHELGSSTPPEEVIAECLDRWSQRGVQAQESTVSTLCGAFLGVIEARAEAFLFEELSDEASRGTDGAACCAQGLEHPLGLIDPGGDDPFDSPEMVEGLGRAASG